MPSTLSFVPRPLTVLPSCCCQAWHATCPLVNVSTPRSLTFKGVQCMYSGIGCLTYRALIIGIVMLTKTDILIGQRMLPVTEANQTNFVPVKRLPQCFLVRMAELSQHVSCGYVETAHTRLGYIVDSYLNFVASSSPANAITIIDDHYTPSQRSESLADPCDLFPRRGQNWWSAMAAI